MQTRLSLLFSSLLFSYFGVFFSLTLTSLFSLLSSHSFLFQRIGRFDSLFLFAVAERVQKKLLRGWSEPILTQKQRLRRPQHVQLDRRDGLPAGALSSGRVRRILAESHGGDPGHGRLGPETPRAPAGQD